MVDVGVVVNEAPVSKGIPPVDVVYQLIVAVADDEVAINVPEFPSQIVTFGADVMVGIA